MPSLISILLPLVIVLSIAATGIEINKSMFSLSVCFLLSKLLFHITFNLIPFLELLASPSNQKRPLLHHRMTKRELSKYFGATSLAEGLCLFLIVLFLPFLKTNKMFACCVRCEISRVLQQQGTKNSRSHWNFVFLYLTVTSL